MISASARKLSEVGAPELRIEEFIPRSWGDDIMMSRMKSKRICHVDFMRKRSNFFFFVRWMRTGKFPGKSQPKIDE